MVLRCLICKFGSWTLISEKKKIQDFLKQRLCMFVEKVVLGIYRLWVYFYLLLSQHSIRALWLSVLLMFRTTNTTANLFYQHSLWDTSMTKKSIVHIGLRCEFIEQSKLWTLSKSDCTTNDWQAKTWILPASHWTNTPLPEWDLNGFYLGISYWTHIINVLE